METVPVTAQRFQIRDFQSSDLENLWNIDQECFPPGISYSRAELRSYLRRRNSFALVATANEEAEPFDGTGSSSQAAQPESSSERQAAARSSHRIAGFLVAEHRHEIGHIITIDVVQRARRYGLGSLLMRAAEDRLLAAGCRAIALETAVDNSAAIAFYKRHQYCVIGTFPRYYSNGVDALAFEKQLKIGSHG